MIKSIATLSHQEFSAYIKNAQIHESFYQIHSGTLKVLECERGIFDVSFTTGIVHNSVFMLPSDSFTILLVGTPFQIKVWQELLKISVGSTLSYQELAHLLHTPQGYRAVANALARNKIAYFIPCHRIIRKDGSLGGYKWGLTIKQTLLFHESNLIFLK